MPKLVLLPGLDGTGLLFQSFIESLPERYEVVVIDYPKDKKLNYDELTEHVLQRLPKDSFILLAESFSGYIAYKIAQKRLETMQSVIFVATFLKNPRPILSRYFLKLPLKLLLSFPFPKILIRKYLLGKNMDKALFKLFRKSIKSVNKDVLIERVKLISTLYPKLEKLNCKATYIQALDDKLVPSICADNFQTSFPNSSILKIQGPHFLLQAKPNEIIKILEQT